MDRQDATVRVFDSVEAADEAAREALRRMTPEERVGVVTEIIGADRERSSERDSGTLKRIQIT